ncbi:WD40 repeat-like protein, partial [Lyophyllum atratum]
SLIALVGAADQPQSSPRKLQIVNTKRQSMICELLFPSSILAVKLNRKTSHCALSPSADSSYLAYPSPVPSPTSPLAAQSSSAPPPPPTPHQQSGDKGTVIRVWSVPGAEKLYQFRRGTREARIYSMNFNVGGRRCWRAGERERQAGSPPESIDSRESGQGLDAGYEAFMEKKKGGGVSSSLRRKSMQMTKRPDAFGGGYLPNTLTEMWEPSRDFAFLRLPTSGARCIVALSGTMPHVMVISSEGIDLEKGGECSLMKQYSLLDSGDESSIKE